MERIRMPLARTAAFACLALAFLSRPSWGWDSHPCDEVHIDDCEMTHGAQLAMAETMFLHSDGESAELTKLIAVTDGQEHVRLYSLDTNGQIPALDFEDEIDVSATGINGPIAFTPSFMDLTIDTRAEPCLVIPVISEGSTASGSISVVRLTRRDAGNPPQLLVMNNRFDCNSELTNYRDLYYVSEDLPGSLPASHAISIVTNPQGYDINNYILYAYFDSSTDLFEATGSFLLPDIYSGDQHMSVPTRPFVTKLQDFEYGTEVDGQLCYTTGHNGGVILWDPAGGESPDIYWISVSQWGTWIYDDDPPIIGELGDVHRAVILEGGSDSFERLGDNITVANRLMFFADFTMGFIASDVSRPTQPQHVWQWDCDSRPREMDYEDWEWHGAGHVTLETIDQADTENYPGETFGIGLAVNSGDSPPTIHLYLAGGSEGLRCFDLSEFLDPFGVDVGTESNYDDYVVYQYDDYEVDSNAMGAFDLQTLSEDGDTYVITSWKSVRTGTGIIGLTIHLDESVVCD